jgi:hypothetical protein
VLSTTPAATSSNAANRRTIRHAADCSVSSAIRCAAIYTADCANDRALLNANGRAIVQSLGLSASSNHTVDKVTSRAVHSAVSCGVGCAAGCATDFSVRRGADRAVTVSCTDDCAVSCPAVPSATLSTVLQPCRQPCCWPHRQLCHLLHCPPRRYHHRQSGLNCGSTVGRLCDGYAVDSSVCRATSHVVSCSDNHAARCVVKHAAISAINSAISCAINRAVTRTARLTSAVQPCHQ